MTETGLSASPDPGTELAARLISLWSVRIPKAIEVWAPQAADAFADGAWIRSWAPRFAAYAPIAAGAVGFLTPFLWPGMQTVYSESLLFMALVVAGAIFSGPVGVMLLLGYLAGDLLNGARNASLGKVGGQFISYFLLAIPAIRIPALARRLADTDQLFGLASRFAVVVILFALACGSLVFLWCQALIVLIRPVFTWRGRSPNVLAIAAVQKHWAWLVALAIATAVARALIEERQRVRSARDIASASVTADSGPDSSSGTVSSRHVPVVVRVALWTCWITLMLAGTYQSWVDAVAVAAVTGTLGAFRAWPAARFFRNWSVWINEVPAHIRLLAGALAGFFISLALLRAFWSTGSFRPLTVGALMTALLFVLLFPSQVDGPSSEETP